jgi:RNAse (barnase) inhibitor barstar
MSAPFALHPRVSGVYAGGPPASLESAVRRAGWAWLAVDVSACGDKDALLAACRRDLALPAHFGGNWDALADCLGDLSWHPAPGYVLVIRGAGRLAREAPQALARLVEVLRAAAGEWRGRATGFIALFDPAPPSLGLAPLAAS